MIRALTILVFVGSLLDAKHVKAARPVAKPTAVLSPTAVSFAAQTVGTTSSPQIVTLSNTGNASLSISSVAITGTNAADFGKSTTCGSSLAAGSSCSISASFTPTIVGSETATLVITDNSSTGSQQSAALSGTGQTETVPPPTSQWSLGYWYGGNNVPISSLQWNALTHLSYVSGQVNADGSVTPKCSFGPCTEAQLGTEANALIPLAHANGVKVLLELDNVSGTRWSGCTSSANLNTCVANIMHLVDAFNYDGVDVDWEASINYTQLGNILTALRAQLGTRLLTFLANAQPAPAPANYAAIAGPADRVNLAIQDQGGNFNPYTWFNNALYSDSNDSEWSVDLAVRRYTAAGIPVAKLLPSIDFYGENQAGATGPRQSVSISSNTQIQYQAIVNTYPTLAANAVHDSITHNAWFSQDGSHWINYNDVQSVKDFVAYMKAKGTGGWFLFALEQDYFPNQTPQHPLMNAVAQAITTP